MHFPAPSPRFPGYDVYSEFDSFLDTEDNPLPSWCPSDGFEEPGFPEKPQQEETTREITVLGIQALMQSSSTTHSDTPERIYFRNNKKGKINRNYIKKIG